MFRSTLIKWAAAAALGLAVPAFALTMSKKAPAKPLVATHKTALAPSTSTPKPAAVRLGQPVKKAAVTTTKKSLKHPVKHVITKKHLTSKTPVKAITEQEAGEGHQQGHHPQETNRPVAWQAAAE